MSGRAACPHAAEETGCGAAKVCQLGRIQPIRVDKERSWQRCLVRNELLVTSNGCMEVSTVALPGGSVCVRRNAVRRESARRAASKRMAGSMSRRSNE